MIRLADELLRRSLVFPLQWSVRVSRDITTPAVPATQSGPLTHHQATRGQTQQPVPRHGRPMMVAEGGQVTTRRAVAVLYHCSELRALSPLQERERERERERHHPYQSLSVGARSCKRSDY